MSFTLAALLLTALALATVSFAASVRASHVGDLTSVETAHHGGNRFRQFAADFVLPLIIVCLAVQMQGRADDAPGLGFDTWSAVLVLLLVGGGIVYALIKAEAGFAAPLRRTTSPARYWLTLLLLSLLAATAFQQAFLGQQI